METDLHIQQFGNETGFKDNFDERMKKLTPRQRIKMAKPKTFIFSRRKTEVVFKQHYGLIDL